MRTCQWEDRHKGRCDKPAVIIWIWHHEVEHFCAEHYDWYADLHLANADEYPDCQLLCKKNGLKKHT